jgi:hypothetical protein
MILDDLAYVTKDQAETSVLFELISLTASRVIVCLALPWCRSKDIAARF